MIARGLIVLAGAVVVPLAALAEDPTFIVTRGTQMFRITGDTVETFVLDDWLHSLEITSDGRFIGTSGTPGNEVAGYELVDAMGLSPALVQTGTVPAGVPTLSNIKGTIYGLRREGDDALLVTYDDVTWAETVVGNLGPGFGSAGGSAYDPISDTFYVTTHIPDTLYVIDYVGATIVGSIALGMDIGFHGGQWFGGQFWSVVHDVASDELVLGTFDVTSGEFTPVKVVLEDASLVPGTVSLAVVPAPAGAVALMALGVLAAGRRRR